MINILHWSQAPRPSTGPHKLRECLPMMVFLRNRLKYALTYTEVKKIVNQRLIKVDGKVRTDKCYPAGFMGMYVLCIGLHNCSLNRSTDSLNMVHWKSWVMSYTGPHRSHALNFSNDVWSYWCLKQRFKWRSPFFSLTWPSLRYLATFYPLFPRSATAY